jgi:hypothetical protein
VSPAHHKVERRWPALGLVVVVLAGVAVLTHTPGPAPTGGPAVSPAALVSPANAESSAWYCTGQSTSSGQIDPGALILTNTTGDAVTGTISSVTDSGIGVQTAVVVPARSQEVPTLPPPSSGSWISQMVILSGGGVAVTQAIKGPAGLSETPCESTTSARWYFPSGVTTGDDGLLIFLFNPTSTPDVVDLSFTTSAGVQHPINFQGIVLQPDQMQVANVAAFVQNQAAVATTVTTRTGRVVASELEQFTGGAAGLSIVSGSPLAEPHWTIPQSLEVAGGSSEIDIYNPGSTTEDVTVKTRLASGPLAPLENKVLPGSTWVLATSTETRLPKGDAYSAVIDAKGGSGVVVGRIVGAPGASQAPQAGLANAIGALTASPLSHEWVVPVPGPSNMQAIGNVLPAHLTMLNDSGATERYAVYVMTPSSVRRIASGSLSRSTFVALKDATLFGAGLHPLLVQSSGPMSISEDVGPSATLGVVTMPGIPMAAALGV